MDGKTVKDSATYMSMVMLPDDANPAGNVHGGVIMKQIDNCGGVAAVRHCRSNAVTASIDRIDFHNPCHVGDLLILKASINYAGRTSMEVGVRVEAESVLRGECRHIASAYLTYVALGADGRPMEVPPLIPETEEEKRRVREGDDRRKDRLAAKQKPKRKLPAPDFRS
jgi:acyl-CoA hydrolase